MAVAELISAEQYLHTSFEHDAEFVEGRIVERPVPTYEHASMQSFLIEALRIIGRRLGLITLPEQRVQTRPDHFRVPDICVHVGGPPKEQIFRTPPFICIEILSPEDRMARVQDRIDDYLKFGVRYVWVINPENRRVWVSTHAGSTEVKDGILRTEDPSLTVSLAEVFAGLDE